MSTHQITATVTVEVAVTVGAPDQDRAEDAAVERIAEWIEQATVPRDDGLVAMATRDDIHITEDEESDR